MGSFQKYVTSERGSGLTEKVALAGGVAAILISLTQNFCVQFFLLFNFFLPLFQEIQVILYIVIKTC